MKSLARHDVKSVAVLGEIRINVDKAATLTCVDGNGRVVFTKRIEYTDFPLPEVRFYFTDRTILLPGEY